MALRSAKIDWKNEKQNGALKKNTALHMISCLPKLIFKIMQAN